MPNGWLIPADETAGGYVTHIPPTRMGSGEEVTYYIGGGGKGGKVNNYGEAAILAHATGGEPSFSRLYQTTQEVEEKVELTETLQVGASGRRWIWRFSIHRCKQ